MSELVAEKALAGSAPRWSGDEADLKNSVPQRVFTPAAEGMLFSEPFRSVRVESNLPVNVLGLSVLWLGICAAAQIAGGIESSGIMEEPRGFGTNSLAQGGNCAWQGGIEKGRAPVSWKESSSRPINRK